MNDSEVTFTVFTPTYNRVHTISRVYESLYSQSFKAFEWVIVDDGSSDNTREIISQWQREAWFPVRYFYQNNRGKHIAFNYGVSEARGELFLSLDSDDSCLPTALEKLYGHWVKIPANQRANFSSVTGLCVNQAGKLVGNKFPKDVTDSDELEIRYKYRVTGEKWGFHRTDVLRRFPYPDLEGEKFVPEGVVWNLIAKHFRTRYINEVLRVYWCGSEDQLTHGGNPSRFSKGLKYWHMCTLNNDIHLFRYSPWSFYKSAVHFSRFSFHCGEKTTAQFRNIRASSIALWILALPVGFWAYKKDQKLI
jgi:glycosyltransferase involved in cell wall biosynthesis